MYNLFLDDERSPSDVTWIDIGKGPWVIVRNQSEFEAYIRSHGLPTTISFDNDLGEDQGQGWSCAQWLIDQILDGHIPFKPFTFTVHSKNPVASKTIEGKLTPFLDHMEAIHKPLAGLFPRP